MTDVTGPDYDPSDPLSPVGQLELTAGSVPLLDRAHELLNQKVIVWIAGGIQVDGKLVNVDDDDLVLTVDDRQHRHHIAIESIAVLSVER